jgi:hypothetical protein
VNQRRRDKIIGIALIVIGALLCSLLILAAFTPIGLVAAPVGMALIVFGALRIDRAASGRA